MEGIDIKLIKKYKYAFQKYQKKLHSPIKRIANKSQIDGNFFRKQIFPINLLLPLPTEPYLSDLNHLIDLWFKDTYPLLLIPSLFSSAPPTTICNLFPFCDPVPHSIDYSVPPHPPPTTPSISVDTPTPPPSKPLLDLQHSSPFFVSPPNSKPPPIFDLNPPFLHTTPPFPPTSPTQGKVDPPRSKVVVNFVSQSPRKIFYPNPPLPYPGPLQFSNGLPPHIQPSRPLLAVPPPAFPPPSNSSAYLVPIIPIQMNNHPYRYHGNSQQIHRGAPPRCITNDLVNNSNSPTLAPNFPLTSPPSNSLPAENKPPSQANIQSGTLIENKNSPQQGGGGENKLVNSSGAKEPPMDHPTPPIDHTSKPVVNLPIQHQPPTIQFPSCHRKILFRSFHSY